MRIIYVPPVHGYPYALKANKQSWVGMRACICYTQSSVLLRMPAVHLPSYSPHKVHSKGPTQEPSIRGFSCAFGIVQFRVRLWCLGLPSIVGCSGSPIFACVEDAISIPSSG